jgi:hypothetical protein
MRPLPGGDALPSVKPRSRKSSVADASVANGGPSNHGPTTFFLKSEGDMEQSIATCKPKEMTGRPHSGNFGVQSLADTLETAFGTETQSGAPQDGKPRKNSTHETEEQEPIGPSQITKNDSMNLRPSPTKLFNRNMSSRSTSIPSTPIHVETQSPSSALDAPGTPTSISLQSLKLSDEEQGLDETISQAVASSGDEEETMPEEMGSFPQLVMPSIQMPSRRPFTVKGKAMGKLKVLVAGEAGKLSHYLHSS